MFEFSLIKNLTIHFGGGKKIEVARGKQSNGIITLSSPLQTKAIDLSKNSTNQRDKSLKSFKKSSN